MKTPEQENLDKQINSLFSRQELLKKNGEAGIFQNGKWEGTSVEYLENLAELSRLTKYRLQVCAIARIDPQYVS